MTPLKLLQEKTAKTFFDMNHSNIFLDHSKVKKIKTKIHKCNLKKNQLLHSKGKPSIKWKDKKYEKKTYRMGEIIGKWCNWQGVNIPNTQTAHTT